MKGYKLFLASNYERKKKVIMGFYKRSRENAGKPSDTQRIENQLGKYESTFIFSSVYYDMFV